jgi:type I restriction enzyme, R subunit
MGPVLRAASGALSVDVLLDASGVVDTSRARSIVESWRAYLDQHRDEITAIQLIGEARKRRISFADIAELAERIRRPTTCLIAASPRDP